MTADPGGKRLGVLAFVAVLVFGSLIARLWYLQVMLAPQFEELTVGNRTRVIWVESPRGRIIDANGRILADRRESLVVTLDWVRLQLLDEEERAVVFLQVADSLNREGIKTKLSGLEADYKRASEGSLKPVVIAEDIDERTWVTISEADLPGFAVEERWVRSYPYGSVGAHILGYTGTVTTHERAKELSSDGGAQHYEAGDELGVSGLERIFESTLRGIPEKRRVEVDARNRIVRTAEILEAGSSGQDIYLTLDIDLQYAAEEILAEQLREARRREACETCTEAHVAQAGSLVALDVTDGSVIALASYPTYDPSDFVFGISAEQFGFLRDRPDQPLFDRATRGTYPAGSTFKPVTAYAALENDVRGEYYPWEDEGVFELESCVIEGSKTCQFQNAGGAVLGTVDLREALRVSSDTYFYSLGEQFWIAPDRYGENSIQDTATLMGFGEPTGIRLPLEQAGRVPTRQNRVTEFGEDSADWRTGDTVNLSIGQGDLLVTPLQLANAYAMLATGGDRYQPRLVERAASSDGETTLEYKVVQVAENALDPVLLQPILDGLYSVPVSGTAAKAFAGFPLDSIQIGGKTGTAEVLGKADYALFAAFGPRTSPKYSVIAILEESGFGGDAAAPAVRQFMEILFGLREPLVAPIVHEARYEQKPPNIEDEIAELADQATPPEESEATPTTSTSTTTSSVVPDSEPVGTTSETTPRVTAVGETTEATAADATTSLVTP